MLGSARPNAGKKNTEKFGISWYTHVGTLNNKASLSHTKHLDNPCPGVQKFSTTTLFENEEAHIELSPPFENVGSRYMVVSNNEPSSTGFTGSNFLRPVYLRKDVPHIFS